MSTNNQEHTLRGRRNFMRTSAAGILSGLCVAGAEATALPAQDSRLALACTPGQMDAFYATLQADLASNAHGNLYLSNTEIEELAQQMVADAEDQYGLKNTLLKFYSASAPSVETVLRRTRELVVADARRTNRLTSDHSALTATSVEETTSQLNYQAVGEVGVPFPLAILRGWTAPFERRDGGISTARVSAALPACPEEIYPRYVGPAAPWKLQPCFHVSFRWRRLDAGCNIHFGSFEQPIKNWVAFAPLVYAMVFANGWGGNLAANNNSLFIKAWTLPPFGIVPPTLPLKLFTRKF